ncbi:MAG: adenosylmethionine decarboxylase [Proteobacteria bacterium]|nr:adenosylmethionine decarboxylase [Pseudomonadota bacterium]
MTEKQEKTRLFGFNNLTKTLSLNIYDVRYVVCDPEVQEYMNYLSEEYNSDRLTHILEDVTRIIGANILNIARADYDPHGASVSLLISEEVPAMEGITNSRSPGPGPESLVAHLDKSHITVHTYPALDPQQGLCAFRADINVSSCGEISPLKALNFLIHSFGSDVVIIDYRVRGFIRDASGEKHFIDHKINSIQNFIDEDTKDQYHRLDVNTIHENLFHTKMMLKEFELNNFLFKLDKHDLTNEEQLLIEKSIALEIKDIFYGRNNSCH